MLKSKAHCSAVKHNFVLVVLLNGELKQFSVGSTLLQLRWYSGALGINTTQKFKVQHLYDSKHEKLQRKQAFFWETLLSNLYWQLSESRIFFLAMNCSVFLILCCLPEPTDSKDESKSDLIWSWLKGYKLKRPRQAELANLNKFNKDRCKGLHLQRSNLFQWHRLGIDGLGRSSAEKDLRVLVHALAARKANSVLGCMDRNRARRSRWFFLLLSTCYVLFKSYI